MIKEINRFLIVLWATAINKTCVDWFGRTYIVDYNNNVMRIR